MKALETSFVGQPPSSDSGREEQCIEHRKSALSIMGRQCVTEQQYAIIQQCCEEEVCVNEQRCFTQVPSSSKKETDLSDANEEELMVESRANGLECTAVDKPVSLVYGGEAGGWRSEMASSD